jgi:hypothetical protein
MPNTNKLGEVAAKKKTTQKAIRADRALVHIPHSGLTFSHKHHVFITKVKRGELWALNHLSVEARTAITPLFELWPNKPAKTFVNHATDLLQLIANDWGKLPFFVDTRYVPQGGVPSASSTKTIFDIARTMMLLAIPTTSIKFGPAFQNEIKNIVALDGRGVLIRLFITDFIKPNLLGNYLEALLTVLQIAPHQADIVIDLEHRPEQVEVQQLGVSAVSALPLIKDWRTVTLASGCFPPSISNVGYGVWVPIQRSDWLGWLYVNSLTTSNGRRVSYGDYGIRCGGIPLDIPRTPDPNIRYSDKQIISVRREKKIDGKMKIICADLLKRPQFSGAGFSEGDAQIAARAAMSGSPNNGQAEQWIQWCTNHHLELTASQIQNLP